MSHCLACGSGLLTSLLMLTNDAYNHSTSVHVAAHLGPHDFLMCQIYRYIPSILALASYTRLQNTLYCVNALVLDDVEFLWLSGAFVRIPFDSALADIPPLLHSLEWKPEFLWRRGAKLILK